MHPDQEHAHTGQCGHGCHGHDHGHDHNHDHDHEHDHGHGHHHHGGVPEPHDGRRGILLSAFGCALTHTHKHYELFEQEVRERYPRTEVRWAFTANRIRAKLRSRGVERLSVAEALSQMVDEGFSHVAVQSLHTLPGVEYDWTVQQAKGMRHPRKGLAEVTIGAPLLRSVDDLERAAKAIERCLLPQPEPGDGIILVGHGTYHQGHALYLALESLLLRTVPNVAMGTLMDREGPALLGKRFLDNGAKRIFLVPFMCVPGHHVQVDLFGDGEHAWKRVLESLGAEVVPVTTGSLEHADFRAIWHGHLDEAVAGLHDGPRRHA